MAGLAISVVLLMFGLVLLLIVGGVVYLIVGALRGSDPVAVAATAAEEKEAMARDLARVDLARALRRGDSE